MHIQYSHIGAQVKGFSSSETLHWTKKAWMTLDDMLDYYITKLVPVQHNNWNPTNKWLLCKFKALRHSVEMRNVIFSSQMKWADLSGFRLADIYLFINWFNFIIEKSGDAKAPVHFSTSVVVRLLYLFHCQGAYLHKTQIQPSNKTSKHISVSDFYILSDIDSFHNCQ